jgi:predicted metal-dependent phosphoesterase TrpH
MLKVDLHTHSADDPVDIIPYSTTELIDRAAALRFDALAVTLHDRQLDIAGLAGYARERGVVLVPGVERTIAGRHILLLNFPAAAATVESFDAVAALKAQYPQGLVIAPHPFFPHANCLREHMDRLADLFDAVELNAFYTATLDFNRRGLSWAQRHRKPLVANSDAHRLPLLGRTFSVIDAATSPDAICAAVKAGRVELRTEPISLFEAASYFGSLTWAGLRRPPDGRRMERAADTMV